MRLVMAYALVVIGKQKLHFLFGFRDSIRIDTPITDTVYGNYGVMSNLYFTVISTVQGIRRKCAAYLNMCTYHDL